MGPPCVPTAPEPPVPRTWALAGPPQPRGRARGRRGGSGVAIAEVAVAQAQEHGAAGVARGAGGAGGRGTRVPPASPAAWGQRQGHPAVLGDREGAGAQVGPPCAGPPRNCSSPAPLQPLLKAKAKAKRSRWGGIRTSPEPPRPGSDPFYLPKTPRTGPNLSVPPQLLLPLQNPPGAEPNPSILP